MNPARSRILHAATVLILFFTRAQHCTVNSSSLYRAFPCTDAWQDGNLLPDWANFTQMTVFGERSGRIERILNSHRSQHGSNSISRSQGTSDRLSDAWVVFAVGEHDM